MSREIQFLLDTVNFAAEKHRHQRFKDPEGTPYINHPIGVATILCRDGGILDLEILQAALLHDTVAYTETSFEELDALFGERVARIVEEVTEDKSLPEHEREQLEVAQACNCSYEAKLVKLADKLDNLQDLNHTIPVGWTVEGVQEYFVRAAQVVKLLQGTNALLEKRLKRLFTARAIDL